MRDFTSKVVAITGGARGQGAAHTRYFAKHGGSVYALDLRDELGEALEKEMRGEGLDVTYRHHDVTSQRDWADLVKHIAARHGTLDVLINNAGIVHTCDLADEDLDRFETVMRACDSASWPVRAGPRWSPVHDEAPCSAGAHIGEVGFPDQDTPNLESWLKRTFALRWYIYRTTGARADKRRRPGPAGPCDPTSPSDDRSW